MKTLLFPLPTEISDVKYASGSFNSIYKSLSKVFNIVPVGPLKLDKNLLHSALNKLNDYNIFPWRFATMHSWKTLYSYGQQIENLMVDLEFDAIFATSTLHAATVKTTKPMFAFTDLSYANALDYYKFASSLFPSSRNEALDVDKYCFGKYKKVFLASEWAKRETLTAYDLEPDKIVVVGRGANITSEFNCNNLSDYIDSRINSSTKNFLFIGSSWAHKGGDIAFNIITELRNKGIDARLIVVGCMPPYKVLEFNYVDTYKYLRRDDKEELKIFKELFAQAFMFIMPTKSDAMGISFNEAASFGLPSISFDTGGVSSAIVNNVTGLLFKPDETVNVMFDEIYKLIMDEERYTALANGAFLKYKNDNNWDTIAKKIQNEIESILI